MSPLQVQMVECVICRYRVTKARAEPLQMNRRGGMWICKKCAADPEKARSRLR